MQDDADKKDIHTMKSTKDLIMVYFLTSATDWWILTGILVIRTF